VRRGTCGNRGFVGGVALLERPALERTRPRVEPVVPLDSRVRDALLLGSFAAVAFTLSNAAGLVSAFGWSLSPLGGATRYVVAPRADGPGALAWLFVAGSLAAALGALSGAEGARRDRMGGGLSLALGGAVLSIVGSAAGIWGDALSSAAGSSSYATSKTLSEVAYGLLAVGLLVIAGGVLAARRAHRPVAGSSRDAGAAWHRPLAVLAVGVAVGAVMPAFLLSSLVSSQSEQLSTVLTYGTQLVSWAVLGWAIVLVGRALRHDARTSVCVRAIPFGVAGTALLAASAGANIGYNELVLRGTALGTQTTLHELSTTLGWGGWLVLSIALGIAAIRLVHVASRADVHAFS
jgi:hypothetical protein